MHKVIVVSFLLHNCLRFMITFILLSLISIPQSVNSQTQFKHSHLFPPASSNENLYHYSHTVQWFCFNYSYLSDENFDCCNLKSSLCTEKGPSIDYGTCATYDGIDLYVGMCNAYFQPSSYNSSLMALSGIDWHWHIPIIDFFFVMLINNTYSWPCVFSSCAHATLHRPTSVWDWV